MKPIAIYLAGIGLTKIPYENHPGVVARLDLLQI
jgi:hypothetical protein